MKKFLPFVVCFFLVSNLCFAKTYTYETKMKFKPYCKDFFRGKAQITFRKKYKKLLKNPTLENQKKLDNIHKYRQPEMENAFKHAFVSAKMTYMFSKKPL